MPRQQARHGKRLTAASLVLAALLAMTPYAPNGVAAGASAAESGAGGPQAKLNPTGRTLSLIVEIRERDRHLGEVAIKITPADAVSVNKAQFVRACAPLLREQAAKRLRGLSAVDGFVSLAALNAAGFETRFDSSVMRVQFTPSVKQRPRGTVRLRRNPFHAAKPSPPARFSGYLNLRTGADYVSASRASAPGFTPPRANLEAVLRWEDVVLETEVTYDGAGRDPAENLLSLSALEGFTRRGTRIVHDRPGDAMRFQAGDINPPVTGFQRGPDMLGVAVERSPRKLRPGENIRPTGERSFRIARPSTVKIELNGIVVRQLRLAPGEYDLKDLPLQSGANDIRLIINDDLGERRVLEFTSYFDASLLAEDIYEWGFAAGVLSNFEDGALSYDDADLIASGYYRRGLSAELTGEAHMQAGRNAAMAGAGIFAATPFGFFGVEGAASYHRDHGAGGALSIDWDALPANDGASSLRLSADLRSPSFAAPGEDDSLQDDWLRLLTSYTRTLPLDVYANIAGRYAFGGTGDNSDDAYSVRLGLSKALGRDFGIGLSLEYSSDPLDILVSEPEADPDDGELRAALRLSWRPDSSSNVTARHETGDGVTSVRASRSVRHGAGSWAANIETVYDAPADDIAADGTLTYTGNRAVVSLEHTASLDATRDITGLPTLSDQRTSLRLGTSIAFADGHVALGRPIADGFAIVAPHDSLADRRILLGDRAAAAGFTDLLGPALVPDLAAYTPRSLRYDVKDLPVGYDLGNQEFTLQPGYKAGYALTVGSAHSVTAFGTLQDDEGKPVGLVTGTAKPASGDAPPVTLFTNGAGRFAAQGVAPGRWEIAMASEPPLRFVLDVPEGTKGLYRAGTLRPVPLEDE